MFYDPFGKNVKIFKNIITEFLAKKIAEFFRILFLRHPFLRTFWKNTLGHSLPYWFWLKRRHLSKNWLILWDLFIESFVILKYDPYFYDRKFNSLYFLNLNIRVIYFSHHFQVPLADLKVSGYFIIY